MHNKFLTAIFSIAMLLLAGPRLASAQGLPAIGPPIPTTIVLTKPAPDQIYGGKTTVTMGVGDKVYKFILKDAYTSHPKIRWPDIWQYVREHHPNFVVQGQDAETFAKIQPGQTVTVFGMFAPLDRTFEVLSVEQGGGSDQRY
jgi:hypothetical protein